MLTYTVSAFGIFHYSTQSIENSTVMEQYLLKKYKKGNIKQYMR
jgi:hypothetical protein